MTQENNAKWVIGIVLVSLVIFGGAMILFQKYRYSGYYFEYNGFSVHRIPKTTGEIYSIQIFIENNQQPYLINSRYDPRELEKISVEENIKDKIINKKELFITMDSKASAVSVLAATEISKITGNGYLFNIPTHGALNAAIEGKNVTVKTCEDVNQDTGIIFLKKGEKEQIYSNKDCVILEGESEESLIKVADRLMLELLNVI